MTHSLFFGAQRHKTFTSYNEADIFQSSRYRYTHTLTNIYYIHKLVSLFFIDHFNIISICNPNFVCESLLPYPPHASHIHLNPQRYRHLPSALFHPSVQSQILSIQRRWSQGRARIENTQIREGERPVHPSRHGPFPHFFILRTFRKPVASLNQQQAQAFLCKIWGCYSIV